MGDKSKLCLARQHKVATAKEIDDKKKSLEESYPDCCAYYCGCSSATSHHRLCLVLMA